MVQNGLIENAIGIIATAQMGVQMELAFDDIIFNPFIQKIIKQRFKN